jgi:hypothetical protein
VLEEPRTHKSFSRPFTSSLDSGLHFSRTTLFVAFVSLSIPYWTVDCGFEGMADPIGLKLYPPGSSALLGASLDSRLAHQTSSRPKKTQEIFNFGQCMQVDWLPVRRNATVLSVSRNCASPLLHVIFSSIVDLSSRSCGPKLYPRCRKTDVRTGPDSTGRT